MILQYSLYYFICKEIYNTYLTTAHFIYGIVIPSPGMTSRCSSLIFIKFKEHLSSDSFSYSFSVDVAPFRTWGVLQLQVKL